MAQNGNGEAPQFLSTIPQEGHDFKISLKDKVIASEFTALKRRISKKETKKSEKSPVPTRVSVWVSPRSASLTTPLPSTAWTSPPPAMTSPP